MYASIIGSMHHVRIVFSFRSLLFHNLLVFFIIQGPDAQKLLTKERSSPTFDNFIVSAT